MIEPILQLEKSLSAWTRLPTAEQRDERRLREIAALAEKATEGVMLSLEQCQSLDMLALRFNEYHHKVLGLINRHPWVPEIHEALGMLEAQLTDGKPHLLNEDRELPRHEREKLLALVDRDLPVICMAIERHNLPTSYCHEIRCAFRNLFDDTRLPTLTYRHKTYVPLLLNQGLTLAADKVSARWNLRLLELFVNHNLNYMGIFERWKDRREAEFTEAEEKGELAACLRRWQQTLSHYNPKPGMVFDPHNESLHGHMKTWLEGRMARPDLHEVTHADTDGHALLTKLVGFDLRVRFHYFFPYDYDYKDPEDAIHDYSAVHVTRRGQHVNPKLLLKFDKDKLYRAARKLHTQLKKIIKRLEAEFGFKDVD